MESGGADGAQQGGAHGAHQGGGGAHGAHQGGGSATAGKEAGGGVGRGGDGDGEEGAFCGSSNPPLTVLASPEAAATIFTTAEAAATIFTAADFEEQVPISVDNAVVLFKSQESAVDSEYLYRCTQPSLNSNLHCNNQPILVDELDDYLITQQSNNLRKEKHVEVFENLSDTEGFLDDYAETYDGASDASSHEGLDYDMAEYGFAEHEEARRQQERELKLIDLKRKRGDEQGHYEGESEVEELFPVSDSEDSEGSDTFVPIALKMLPVRKGPTSRSHGSVACTSNPDYFPSDDQYFEVSEDSEDCMEPPVLLPSGRKSRAKKMKERMWYDEHRLHPEQQFCLKLCFVSVYQFRLALQNLHISQLRTFTYHRNTPDSIIAMCIDEDCPFFMTASKIAGEKTFCIRKMHLAHTCRTSGESCKVNCKWLAKTAEQSLRADPRTRIESVIDNAKQKHGVEVGKVVAYRARKKALKVVLGDELKQYTRIRDYLQTMIDTNPGSRCIVTTKMVLEAPSSNPRFHGLFMALGASIEGFTLQQQEAAAENHARQQQQEHSAPPAPARRSAPTNNSSGRQQHAAAAPARRSAPRAFTALRSNHVDVGAGRPVRQRTQSSRLKGYLNASRIHEKTVEELKREGRYGASYYCKASHGPYIVVRLAMDLILL